MKIQKLICIGLTLASVSGVSWSAQDFKIDPAWSHVEFSVKNFKIHTVEGRFKTFSGTISFDETDVARSKVTTVIPVSGIDTGIAKRDKHLQEPEFFEAAKYPDITFQSLQVSKQGERYELVGPLTIKGHTQDVHLPFTYSLSKTTDGVQTLRAEAHGAIKRRDFGIDYGSNFSVGNEVQFVIHIQALPEKP